MFAPHDASNLVDDTLENQALGLLHQTLIEQKFGKCAAVSSFGAESAVLLHLASRIDRDVPIVFLDTRMMFEETLRYRDTLIEFFDLTNVRTVHPDHNEIRERDIWGSLHRTDANSCCDMRKTRPLENALAPFNSWVSGRKGFQSKSRARLPTVEKTGDGKTKINPLLAWSADALATYAQWYALPQHPLVNAGYPSIGCAACTTAVSSGEDPRAGRWRGNNKTECGIHIADGKILRGTNPQ